MVDVDEAARTYVTSNMLGSPFSTEALQQGLSALLDAYRGGLPASDLPNPLKLPEMDEAARREMLLRRFRLQAKRAAEQTAYYHQLFRSLNVDPEGLTWDEIPSLPVTRKTALRERPYDFVCHDAVPVYRGLSGGTTGRPTGVAFSTYEVEVASLLMAIGELVSGVTGPEDIQLSCLSARGSIAVVVNADYWRRLGTTFVQGGQADSEYTLALIAEEQHLPGKWPKVSLIVANASYLGQVIEDGLRLGYRPSNFALRRIETGGEVVSVGLRRRALEVFGQVPFLELFGMTETYGSGGASACEEGHMHFSAVSGLPEFVDPDAGHPAAPGEIATLVSTPLCPYRDTTLLLRYDTHDLVRMPDGPLACSRSHTPAVQQFLGKRDLAVRHDHGWTTPRDVIEALEVLEVVPLPARFGFWAAEGGVVLEVVVRGDPAKARNSVGENLEARGVPLKELHVLRDRSDLTHPYPLRGDFREMWLTRSA